MGWAIASFDIICGSDFLNKTRNKTEIVIDGLHCVFEFLQYVFEKPDDHVYTYKHSKWNSTEKYKKKDNRRNVSEMVTRT